MGGKQAEVVAEAREGHRQSHVASEIPLRVHSTNASNGELTQTSRGSPSSRRTNPASREFLDKSGENPATRFPGERDEICNVHARCQGWGLAVVKWGRTLTERRFHGRRDGIVAKQGCPGPPRGIAREAALQNLTFRNGLPGLPSCHRKRLQTS